MRTLPILFLAAAILLAPAPAATAATPILSKKVYGPSPWLPFDQFEHWLHTNLKGKHVYIVSATGRLWHGISEWRVRWSPAPEHVEWYWYWWFGSTGPEYEAHAAPLVGKNGFDEIWLQSFVDATGVRRYQSIYLKIVWPAGTKPDDRSYHSPRFEISAPGNTSVPATVGNPLSPTPPPSALSSSPID